MQIVYSSRRVARRMKHVGSAHDEQELEALLAAAAAVVVVCTISTVIRVLSALRHRQLAAPRRRSRDRRPPCAPGTGPNHEGAATQPCGLPRAPHGRNESFRVGL